MVDNPTLKYGIALYEIHGQPPPTMFHWALVVTSSANWSSNVEKMSVINWKDGKPVPWEFLHRPFGTFNFAMSDTLVGIVEIFTSEVHSIPTVLSWARDEPAELHDYKKFGSGWSCAFWVLHALEILSGTCGLNGDFDPDAYIRVLEFGRMLKARKEKDNTVLHLVQFPLPG